MEDDVEREKLATIQDFYSKRTVAHASFFVSSLFGLFTLLSLMLTVKARGSTLVPLETILVLLLVPYGIVWFFGLYSLFNFDYYASLAEHAETKIASDKMSELALDIIDKRKGIMKRLFRMKAGFSDAPLKRFRVHKIAIFLTLYAVLGLLPLVVIWILS